MTIRTKSNPKFTLLTVLACVLTSKQGLAKEVGGDQYHVGVGVARPLSLGNDYNHYDKLFGSPSSYPELFVDYRLISIGSSIHLGFFFKLGIYRDSGKSVRYSESIDLSNGGLNRDLSDADIDESQKSVLTMVPTQAALSATFSPLNRETLLLTAWAGLGYTYIENTTIAKVSSSFSEEEVTPYLNSGFSLESVQGVSMSIDISQVDPRSSYSLRVYGVENIFLTPFFQNINTLNKSAGTYNRQVYGLMFSFDTKVL